MQHVGNVAVDVMDRAASRGSVLAARSGSRWRAGRGRRSRSSRRCGRARHGRTGRRRRPSPTAPAGRRCNCRPGQVPARRRARHDRADFGSQFRAHALVGVDLENPIAAAGGNPGLPARRFSRPSPFDHPAGELAGDFARAVGAAVEQRRRAHRQNPDLARQPASCASSLCATTRMERCGPAAAWAAGAAAASVALTPPHSPSAARARSRRLRRPRPTENPSACRW